MRRLLVLTFTLLLTEGQLVAQDQQRTPPSGVSHGREVRRGEPPAEGHAPSSTDPSSGRAQPTPSGARAPSGGERVGSQADAAGPRRVRVRATVAVIDPQVGVSDIISQLRKTDGERRELRAKQMATAVELRRVGPARQPVRAGAARGKPSPPGGKPVTGRGRDRNMRSHEVNHPRVAGGSNLPDAQRMTGRERMSERQGESRMRERLEKRRDMVNWRRSRAEQGRPKDFREREGKR